VVLLNRLVTAIAVAVITPKTGPFASPQPVLWQAVYHKSEQTYCMLRNGLQHIPKAVSQVKSLQFARPNAVCYPPASRRSGV